jgi:hypothetical protein
MNVLAAAAAIGIGTGADNEAFGTIEEEVVLEALAVLAREHPGNDDLFAEAAARVQLSRSAGVERIERDSVFALNRNTLDIQLRYRSEMLEVFTDLAIDLALRSPAVADESRVAPVA